MCGIIGAVSERNVTPILIEGLKRLEYRGYDSAGVAVIDNNQQLKRVRVLGKVKALADALMETSINGNLGIAHTRWATHGKPNEANAHPQVSHGKIAVVHNGIIENYESIRAKLQQIGYIFTSETDTEVAAHLVHFYYEKHEDLLKSVQDAALEMQGAFALGVIHEDCKQQLVAVRKGSPLVIGIGISERFIGSDVLALRSFAQNIIYLEDGDSALLTSESVKIYNAKRQIVERSITPLPQDMLSAVKGDYRHFMRKEIDEQSHVLANTLEGKVGNLNILRASFGHDAYVTLQKVKSIHIVACGTSYHAGLVARFWLESLTNIPTQVEIASEYRYRDVVVPENSLLIAISQSGETADLLAAVSKAKDLNYLATFAICNVATSSLVRECQFTCLTRAGIEIGVASTKAFTTQLAVLLMLALALCKDARAEVVLKELQGLPEACDGVLKLAPYIEKMAASVVHHKDSLFLGRGVFYPIALEGALKLKEISYIHAEAYPAGELKHGPLALVDKDMPVIIIAPNDPYLDKIKSNIQEVKTRNGQIILFTEKATGLDADNQENIILPSCPSWIAPILYTIPMQLLAYFVAVAKGTDVDQPRNLAKSVTVE
ncbi:MAG: glutamine--fructose-6-phosphate aminotransferase [Gammaproteobacteria bacterium RIFCSPHIGHO2_12_FULL_41_15]|nr:MAG: glutamine--fructose-6-phosphate aminotransferase [Gammaproteobacteria bacterium RIFCSPHIGHO2_12_FULL_41_15]